MLAASAFSSSQGERWKWILAWILSLLIHLGLAGYVRLPQLSEAAQLPRSQLFLNLKTALPAPAERDKVQQASKPKPTKSSALGQVKVKKRSERKPSSRSGQAQKAVKASQEDMPRPADRSQLAETAPSVNPGEANRFLPVVFEPRYLTPPSPPSYPPKAIRFGWQGEVIVRALVDQAGEVQTVVIYRSSGYRILDQAAREAAAKWRFVPAVQNGQPIAVWVQVPVRFELVEAG